MRKRTQVLLQRVKVGMTGSLTKKTRELVIVAGAVLVTSCTPPYGNEHERVEGAFEAVARWAIQKAETDLDPPAAYCVAVPQLGEEDVRAEPNADPTTSFLRRLADIEVPVRPLSACDVLNATAENFLAVSHHSIVDRESGQFGLLILLGPLEWADDRGARVYVGVVQGGLRGLVGYCDVAWRERDAWPVPECSTEPV